MTGSKEYTPNEINEIAQRLRDQRKKLHLSQRALGEKIDVKKDVIQRLESGKLKIIDDKKLYFLAAVLDCNPAYLTLDSDDPRTQHSDEVPYYNAPAFKYSAESFLYNHDSLYLDLTYAQEYMHPEFQNALEDIINTFVTFHKCGVHYPNVDAETASKISLKKCDQFIKEHFFEKERQRSKNWELPRRPSDLGFK